MCVGHRFSEADRWHISDMKSTSIDHFRVSWNEVPNTCISICDIAKSEVPTEVK
jgi:hypothetical protein